MLGGVVRYVQAACLCGWPGVESFTVGCANTKQQEQQQPQQQKEQLQTLKTRQQYFVRFFSFSF